MNIEKYRLGHHLFDNANGILYCYVAKNACSTMKFHFMKKNLLSTGSALDEQALNAGVHVEAKNFSIRELATARDVRYAFMIVRHPYERIASAFLDKFVRSEPIPAFAQKLLAAVDKTGDLSEITFRDFVKALAVSPVENLNEHWMPQYMHCLQGVAYDFVAIEDIAKHTELKKLYGDLSRNVREHTLRYSSDYSNASELPRWQLRRELLERGVVPSWDALVTEELKDQLQKVFGPDWDMYRSAKQERQVEAAGLAGEKKPLISVVVPFYNVERYLEECLLSLANQDDDACEVVLVDDGGSDGSIEIAKRFVVSQPNFRLVRQENRGLGGARNTGIREARGQFVIFVDSDDFVSTDMVSSFRSQQMIENADVVSGDYVLMPEEGGEYQPSNDGTKAPEWSISLSQSEKVLGVYSRSIACNRMYKKSLIVENDLFFPEFVPHEDWFFTYKVLRCAVRPVSLAHVTYYWRQRKGSLSKSLTEAHLNSIARMVSDTLEFLKRNGGTEREYDLAARRILSVISRYWNKAQDFGDEKFSLFKALLISLSRDLDWCIERVASSRFLTDRKLVIRITQCLSEALENKNEAVGSTEIDFVFFPLRAYHLNECLTVIDQLQSRGRTCAIVTSDKYRNGKEEVTQAAKGLAAQTIDFDTFLARRLLVRCCVLFNDWDPLMRLIARDCQLSEVQTVGWVEGIQDYADVDTGRPRNAYRRVGHVVAPGVFDTKYFSKSPQSVHVGEVVRVRDLWKTARKGKASEKSLRRALINSNFSYGVLEEHRDGWVRQAVCACQAAGIEPVISRHPFDLGMEYKELETTETFIDAAARADVVIQRFASGVLESLAVGTPVIYFNPHGEKVDKFMDPKGAYRYVDTADGLVDCLTDERYFWDEQTAREFLRLHAGLTETDEAPGSRIATILEDVAHVAAPPTAELAERLENNANLKSLKTLRAEANRIGPLYPDEVTASASTDQPEQVTLNFANRLFRENDYKGALAAYRELIRRGGVYKMLEENVRLCNKRLTRVRDAG